jgi:hypothetical protein
VPGQPLVEYKEAGERGHSRLEAHQDPENARRHAAQGFDLERVGHGRGHDRHQEAEGQDSPAHELRAAVGDSYWRGEDGTDCHRQRQALGALEGLADPRRQQDVRRPEAARKQGECDTQGIEVRRAEIREKQDPRRGERHPDEVQRAPRARDGYAQGTDELDRHRDPERDPVDGRVDRQVHRRERRTEQRNEPPVGSRAPAYAGWPDEREHDRGEHEPQQNRSGRTNLVEERLADRSAEL